MTFTVGDGYTFWCDEVYPIEYESVEKAEYDFLMAWEAKIKDNEFPRNPGWKTHDFTIFGREFDPSDFTCHYTEGDEDKAVYDEPKFYTLEDWWEKNLKG